MNDPEPMQRFEANRHLTCNFTSLCDGQRSLPLPNGEGVSLEPLEHYARCALVVEPVGDVANHVRAAHPREQTRFLDEASELRWIVPPGHDSLDRDALTGCAIASEKDLSVRPAPNLEPKFKTAL